MLPPVDEVPVLPVEAEAGVFLAPGALLELEAEADALEDADEDDEAMLVVLVVV